MFGQNGYEMACVRLRLQEAQIVGKTPQDGYKPLTLLNSAC
jgi:hypothetical protein